MYILYFNIIKNKPIKIPFVVLNFWVVLVSENEICAINEE